MTIAVGDHFDGTNYNPNAFKKCAYYRGPAKDSERVSVQCVGIQRGRYLGISLNTKPFTMCEVEVFACGAGKLYVNQDSCYNYRQIPLTCSVIFGRDVNMVVVYIRCITVFHKLTVR